MTRLSLLVQIHPTHLACYMQIMTNKAILIVPFYLYLLSSILASDICSTNDDASCSGPDDTGVFGHKSTSIEEYIGRDMIKNVFKQYPMPGKCYMIMIMIVIMITYHLLR